MKILLFFLFIIPSIANASFSFNPFTGKLDNVGSGGASNVGIGTSGRTAVYTSTTNVGSSGVMYDNGTNIGISSAVPGQKLDVAGTIRSTGLEGLTASILTIATNQGIGIDPVNATYTTPKLVLNTSGNVGINTTTAPNTLYVAGTTETQGFKLPDNGVASGYVLTSNSVGVGTWMPSSGSGVSGITTNYIPKAASSTSLNDSAMYQSGSNIGVGSTNPGQVLDVTGTIRASGTLVSTGTGDTLLAQTSGNVGINSATPGQKLDVQGTIRATGFTLTGASSGTIVCNLNGALGHCSASSSCLTTCTCTCVVP